MSVILSIARGIYVLLLVMAAGIAAFRALVQLTGMGDVAILRNIWWMDAFICLALVWLLTSLTVKWQTEAHNSSRQPR